jgi:large conductance mechanosensitive channel
MCEGIRRAGGDDPPDESIPLEEERMLKEFREFILRGNLVDLAVAVVIGAAFGTVIAALVKDIITPVIAAIGGKPDFSALTFTVNKSKFLYGDFNNAVISFVIVAGAVFFFVIKPVNVLMKRFKSEPPTDENVRKCPQCLSEIPRKATRCAFCTADVGAATV